MYAIVDIAGQQFKVEKDQKLFVHRLEGEEGNQVSFDKVLLIDSGNKIMVGDPVVKGACVDAKIIAHVKGDKVLVFKKKRRKGYQKLNGHRQYMTQIQIEGITESGAKPKKAETAKKEPSSRVAEGDEVKSKPKTSGKPAEEKKETAGKPAAQKKGDDKESKE